MTYITRLHLMGLDLLLNASEWALAKVDQLEEWAYQKAFKGINDEP